MNRRSSNSTKVFIGSLPPEATVENLRKLFSPYGVISECDIANRCGFLHLEDKDLAMKAIEELNDTQFLSSRISVELGRSRVRRGGNGPPPRNYGDRMREGPMGRDRGPYSRDYGGRAADGPDRSRDYDRDYYGDRNSVLTPIHNDDRSFSSYEDRRSGPGGMSIGQNQSIYNSRYSADNHRSSYQPIPNNSYSTVGGGSGRGMGGYNTTSRMGGDGGGIYDDPRSSSMSTGIMGDRPALPPSNFDMDYTRRESGLPKQLMSIGGYGDRTSAVHLTAGGYPAYSSVTSQNGGGYQMSSSGYGDSGQMAGSTSGYASLVGGGYTSAAGGYGSTPSGGGGGYYDDSYLALSQQRSGYAATYEPPSNYHY